MRGKTVPPVAERIPCIAGVGRACSCFRDFAIGCGRVCVSLLRGQVSDRAVQKSSKLAGVTPASAPRYPLLPPAGRSAHLSASNCQKSVCRTRLTGPGKARGCGLSCPDIPAAVWTSATGRRAGRRVAGQCARKRVNSMMLHPAVKQHYST